MNWAWLRRWRQRPQSGAEGLAEAQRRLDDAHAQDPEIKSLAAQLRLIRERNNFASMIATALREHR
jgi:hypothetical protein